MNAGRLHHLVRIEQPTKSRTASGDTQTVWECFADAVYAQITPLKGRELYNAHTILPEATHEVTIRYTPGVTSDMRLVHRDRILQIGDVPRNLHERDVTLTFLCIETT